MNRYQPSANSHAVDQRIDDRRAAAANYRLAKIDKKSGPNRLTTWRCAIGNRLVSAGESMAAQKLPRLPTS